MITLRPVKKEEKEFFYKMNQNYLYEMTLYYPDDPDENGDYQYGYFDEYFTDEKRKAFFILNGEKTVGFVMINPYSFMGAVPDYVMAEFTVFPSYRRNHYALDAVKLIFDKYPGKWEIKYNEKNIGAKKLWTGVAARYNPVINRLNEYETVLEFTIPKDK